MRLKDKVAIVTGSAQGIGRIYALRLASEGARVVVTDMQDAQPVADEIAAKGGEALALRTDVADAKSVEEMARSAVARFGRIDILVNNAALFGVLQRRPFEQIPDEEWDRVMAVNVKGLFLCCREVLAPMKRQRKGRIINISSGTVLQGTPQFLHYVTSKGAVVALSRALAREVGEFGITVNTIAPGHTLSEVVRRRGPNADERAVATRAIRRSQVPEDLAGTVVFLASDDSEFITGQMIVVDGGSALH
jgi:NAD(P)-dependent dehydrogenase (short-subunit alcohol dehydrogenase family)